MEANDVIVGGKVEKIYTPLSTAKEEIWRRWNDKDLRKKVEEFLGDEFPDVFKEKPLATIFRYIQTPNLEFEMAMDSSAMLGLDMLFMEFLKDKFCTTNKDKVCLGKMYFYEDQNDENGRIKSVDKIVDFTASEGVAFENLKTVWGGSLVDFHRKIMFDLYGNVKRFDASDLKKNGETAYEVYLKVFSLFVCNGVLFENYFINTNERERKFTYDVIIPAFRKVTEMFGVRPLVVPLVGQKDDGDVFWQYYNVKIIDKIKINKKEYAQFNHGH